jgi:hypothetical protein
MPLANRLGRRHGYAFAEWQMRTWRKLKSLFNRSMDADNTPFSPLLRDAGYRQATSLTTHRLAVSCDYDGIRYSGYLEPLLPSNTTDALAKLAALEMIVAANIKKADGKAARSLCKQLREYIKNANP